MATSDHPLVLRMPPQAETHSPAAFNFMMPSALMFNAALS